MYKILHYKILRHHVVVFYKISSTLGSAQKELYRVLDVFKEDAPNKQGSGWERELQTSICELRDDLPRHQREGQGRWTKHQLHPRWTNARSYHPRNNSLRLHVLRLSLSLGRLGWLDVAVVVALVEHLHVHVGHPPGPRGVVFVHPIDACFLTGIPLPTYNLVFICRQFYL